MSRKGAKPFSKVDTTAFAQALAAAPRAALPAKLSPQLATLAAAPPKAGDWVYEIKFDGYRILGRLEDGRARLFTRNGHDWTGKMQSLAAEVEKLGIDDAWLDGEAVVMGADGLPSFNALQNAFDQAGTEAIILYVFDVPFLDGKDLRGVPLRTRRAILQARMGASVSDRVRFSEAFGADGASVLQSACKMGLEGVIAKRLDARYELRRTETWLKLKCHRRQEFVVGGFTDRAGGRQEVGSLLLGVYDDEGRLRSAGSVGTGWSAADGGALWKQLAKLEAKTSPFDAEYAPTKGRWSKRASGSERWVKPTTVAEVSFAEWTPDGSVRHASFEGLRVDKPATSIRRETAASVALPAPRASSSHRKAPPPIKVSNADRVIDASTGLKKIDLVRYYESVVEWILPHLKGRPTSLVRGPDGIGGELFFQKHGEKIGIPGIRELDPSLWPGHKGLLEIPSTEALVGAAQLNVIEFHTWNSTAKEIDRPDRMIFDLDPGEGVPWAHIQEAATLMRVLLTELGLASWLKTSGGKGLHVVVPLAPQFDYDTVKEFSKAVVVHLARTIPSRFVAKSGGGNRIGKIFVDYLRNGHGATTAAAFSARARPGLGVSIPIKWEQLSEVKSGAQWTIATARAYLSQHEEDPWAAYWANKQTLKRPMKTLGFAPPSARK
jgi:bifunctional non-homologous end joining protein LigD